MIKAFVTTSSECCAYPYTHLHVPAAARPALPSPDPYLLLLLLLLLCSMAVDQEPDLAAGPSDTAEQTQPAGTAAAAAAGGGAAGNGSTATNGPASATTAAAGSMAVDGEGPAAEAAGASGGQEGVEVWRCGGRDWMRDGALPVRQFVRRAIMEGRVQAAVDCISHTFPQVRFLQG